MIDRLVAHLNKLTPGVVEDATEIEWLLSACWDDFSLPQTGGMTADKLSGRMESVEWEPPRLRFVVERHGPTVLGSTTAKMQPWTIDVEERIATTGFESKRPVGKKNPPLDVKPLAESVFAAIVSKSDDPRLKWNADGSVRVLIGEVILDNASKETVQDRRKRFRSHLEELLAAEGWGVLGYNKYGLPGH